MDHISAVDTLETNSRILIQRLKSHGFDATSCNLFQHVILESNSLAMLCLSRGDGSESKQWLDKAKALAETSIPGGLLVGGGGADEIKGPSSLSGLKVLTLNNLACWQKAGGSSTKAVETLKQAISVTNQSNPHLPPQQQAVTHSNMAASLSSLDDHVGARRHAKIAVQHCKEDLKRFSEGIGESNEVLRARVMNGDSNVGTDEAPHENEVSKTVSSLAVACHNLAVETEFTQGGERALGWYKRAAELVKVQQGEASGMKQKILTSYFNAKRKYNPRQKKSAGSGAKAVKSLRKNNKTMSSSSSSNFFISKTEQQAMTKTLTNEYNSYQSVREAVASKNNATRVVIPSPDLDFAEEVPVPEDDGSVELPIDQDLSSNDSDNNTLNASRPKSAGFERPFKNSQPDRPKTAGTSGRAKGFTATAPAATSSLYKSNSSPSSPARVNVTPEKARDNLVDKIEEMDRLANEARQALTDMAETVGVASPDRTPPPRAKTTGQRRPKSAQPAMMGRKKAAQSGLSSTGGYQNPHTYTPTLPPYASELLASANKRNQGNIRKLIEQREAARELLVSKEAEVKGIKYSLKKIEREKKEKEDFTERLVQGLQNRVENFDGDQSKLLSECQKQIEEVRGELEGLRSLNIKLASEKVKAEHSAVQSRQKYIDCCSVLAKEKLLKRVQEVKASKSVKKEMFAKGQKNLQMLVFKNTIERLNKQLTEERAHSMEVEKHLRQVHQKHDALKVIDAKSKLKARLDKIRQDKWDDAGIEFDIGAVKSSPMNSWMNTNVSEDLGEIAGDEKHQADTVLDKIKINSLCDLIDDYELECEEFQGSHLNNEPTQEKIEDMKAKLAAFQVDEEKRLAVEELKVKELEDESNKLNEELEEKEGTIYELQDKLEICEAKLDVLEKEKDKAWFKSDEEASLAETKLKLDDANYELGGLKGIVEELEKEKKELEGLVGGVKAEHEAKVEAVRAELEAIGRQQIAAAQQLVETERAANEMTAVKSLGEERENLNSAELKLKEMEEENAKLKGENAKLSKGLAVEKTNLEQAMAKIEEWERWHAESAEQEEEEEGFEEESEEEGGLFSEGNVMEGGGGGEDESGGEERGLLSNSDTASVVSKEKRKEMKKEDVEKEEGNLSDVD
ncbi:hypothetical protein TrLO_g9028 [Triparma laevis f. longispina]|uniref:Uncharacterized protein n=1 Tax=Triparma laevis f. longispina TaxID=1714387 RepID=A0A9W7KT66_9STRA|nr:hypothetical protein TrLO_g9028 [Triparma laevis f. longispina]